MLRYDCRDWRHGIAKMTLFVWPLREGKYVGWGERAQEAFEHPKTRLEVTFLNADPSMAAGPSHH